MATNEQIEKIAEDLSKAHPTNLLKMINDFNAGSGFALKLLYSAKENRLSAGEISEAMCVSTARVAVLLKKMESKGLVVRESNRADARVTIVRLTEEGRIAAQEMREQILKHISCMIDQLGMEKLEQYIALSVEVKTAMEKNFLPKT